MPRPFSVRQLALALLCWSSFPASGEAAPGDKVFYVTGSTQPLCQLTGQRDQNGQPKFGVIGTDLGYPVEHKNPMDPTSILYIFYGDSVGSRVTALDPQVEFRLSGTHPVPNPTLNLESVGFSGAASPASLCTDHQFIAGGNGVYAVPQVDLMSYPSAVRHMRHGTFGVPGGGFSWGGRLYVFFAHLDHVLDGDPERRVILASIADPRTVTGANILFKYEFEVSCLPFTGMPGPVPCPAGSGSTGKFLNFSPVLINRADFAPQDLPADGAPQALLLFASGDYKKSPPVLAYVPLPGSTVPDTSNWYYFAGLGSTGLPVWLKGESNAVSLFSGAPNFGPCPPSNDKEGPCIGELSVTWNQYLRKWLILYNGNSSEVRGILFHVADKPWGPWSDVVLSPPPATYQTITAKDATISPSLVFNPAPEIDKGYLHFMHLVVPDDPKKNCTNVFDRKNPMAAPECDDGNSSTMDICNRDARPPFNQFCLHSWDNLSDSAALDFDSSGNLVGAGVRTLEVAGEYGPFVIPRFTTGDSRSTTIYFLMSTWNPYQVFLMKSTLRLQRPPVANAGVDQTASVGSNCTAQVMLDGGASSDADGDTLTYNWTGPFGTATGPSPVVTLPLGTFTITLTVDDSLPGGRVTDTVVITTKDVTPPVVSASVLVPRLWPPDHGLVNVGLAATAIDNCDGSRPVTIAGFGDEEDEEPTGDGTFSPDAKNIGPGTLRLRSERKGDGDGRVYLIKATAADLAGNVGFNCVAASVPLSSSASFIASAAAQTTSAEAYCLSHNGAPPPGYFVVGDGPVIGPIQ